MELLKVAFLFAVTAVAEIVSCYLPWLVVKTGQACAAPDPGRHIAGVFAWLLTLHPSVAGRAYAADGGMYIAVVLAWLHFVNGVALTRWDLAGASVALAGMAIIALQPAASASRFRVIGWLQRGGPSLILHSLNRGDFLRLSMLKNNRLIRQRVSC